MGKFDVFSTWEIRSLTHDQQVRAQALQATARMMGMMAGTMTHESFVDRFVAITNRCENYIRNGNPGDKRM